MQLQIDELKKQVTDYEKLKTGRMKLPDLQQINEVSDWLVKWRIARGWTQKDLAERLGLAEQQIQRYEKTDYASASLETIKKVAALLRRGHPSSAAKTQQAAGKSRTALPKRKAAGR